MSPAACDTAPSRAAGRSTDTVARAERGAEAGYAMAVLLVSLSVMSVMLSVALPVWKTMAQREKEAELIFRGQQYARAIGLFQRRAGPGTLPPSIDVLVEQKFLRRKYKDPITGQDFVPLRQTPGGVTGPAGPGQTPGGRGQTPGARGQQPPSPAPVTGRTTFSIQADGERRTMFANQPGGVAAGIIGVASKSTDQSIRLYNGRNHYNEWEFVFVAQTQSPGAGGPGVGAPGAPGPGQPGPGGRGGGPGRGFGPGADGRGFGPGPGGPGTGGGRGDPRGNPGGGFPPQFPGTPGGGGLGAPPSQPPGR